MKWFNLKQNKCPKCSEDLADKLEGNIFRCTCGFVISAKRFKEIIADKVNRQISSHYRPEDENPDINIY